MYINIVEQALNNNQNQDFKYLDNTLKNFRAGETISGQSLVMLNNGVLFKFNQSDENNFSKTIGITQTSANIGDLVNVIYQGKLNNPGWNLTPNGIYYAGDNGSITTTVPLTGIILRVGIAIDSDNLNVSLSHEYIVI